MDVKTLRRVYLLCTIQHLFKQSYWRHLLPTKLCTQIDVPVTMNTPLEVNPIVTETKIHGTQIASLLSWYQYVAIVDPLAEG